MLVSSSTKGLFRFNSFVFGPNVVVAAVVAVAVVVVVVVVLDVVGLVVVVVVVVGLGVVIGIRMGVVDDVIASDPVTRIGFLFDPTLAAAADDADMEKMFFASC